LESLLGTKIRPTSFYKYPTIGALAAYLATLPRMVGPAAEENEKAQIAALIAKEAKLQFEGRPAREGGPGSVFLTGSTGFLGKFLLSEILSQTKGSVFCLVRGDTGPEGLRKLVESARSFALDLAPHASRIVLVNGVLEKVRFGLSDPDYQRIAESASCILLNAARVNHLANYDELRSENVQSIETAVELASRSRAKEIIFASTTAVEVFGRAINPSLKGEEYLDVRGLEQIQGYAASKAVAELKLRDAIAHGYSVKIVRICELIGDARTGFMNQGDQFMSFLLGCLEVGLFPAVESYMAVLPVNLAAQAMVALIGRDAQGLFNLSSANAFGMGDLDRVLKALRAEQGLDLERLPEKAFFEEFVQRATPSNPFSIFLKALAAGPSSPLADQPQVSVSKLLLALGPSFADRLVMDDESLKVSLRVQRSRLDAAAS
jgi:thioester reductase-like protein